MQQLRASVVLALVLAALALVYLPRVQARDGGDTPQDALRQYKEMQEKKRVQPAKPAPATVRRTPVRASPFAVPKPKLARPAPVIPPPTLFVHVLGDSLAGQLADGLKDVMSDRHDVGIIDDTKADSGLVRDDFHDWNKVANDLVASNQRIDAVVILLGSNDNQPLKQGDGWLAPQSDAWKAAYLTRLDALLATFRSRNIPVFWVGLPPMRNEALSAAIVLFNGLYRDRVTAARGTFVDIWDGFVNSDGGYLDSGTGLDGQPATLRRADGVHFSKEGARVAAHFAETELRRILGGAAPDPQTAVAPLLDQPDGSPSASAEKPEYGPVQPLNSYETTPGGLLLSASAPSAKSADPSVAKVLVEGSSLPPKEGRADDFRWPPPNGNGQTDSSASAERGP